jgi:hypothetical protein
MAVAVLKQNGEKHSTCKIQKPIFSLQLDKIITVPRNTAISPLFDWKLKFIHNTLNLKNVK